MSMEAASYIATLKELAPVGDKPVEASYAIIDLAVGHDVLKQLYSAFESETTKWWSLFEGSEWQRCWSSGPILVDLRNSESLTQQLTADMEARPLGVLIQTALKATDLRDRCQSWLLGSGGSQLLRFHEPRMLGPLLSVMGDMQRSHFIPRGEQWFWHDGKVWRTHMSVGTECVLLNEKSLFSVSEDQLIKASHYRMVLQAEDFARHYENNLTSLKDPRAWVLNRLLEAHKAGMTRVSEQERWLRLVITNGERFQDNAEQREILKKEHWTASEKLTAMESLRELDSVSTK